MNNRIPAEALPNEAEPRAWRFAGFEFDRVRGELTGAAGAIPLRPKADLLLRLFLARPGELLGRDELMNALWPAAVVTDDSLVQCVGELRTALGDRDQRLIRTVPKRGYRFETGPEAVSPPVPAGTDSDAAGQPAPARPPRRRASASAALAAGLICAGVAAWAALRWAAAPAPVRIDDEIAAMHVFAVMPFKVASDAPGLRDIADEVADQVAVQIGTRPGTRVIGRGKTAPLAEAPLARLAGDLNATYAISGRVAAPVAAGRGVSVDVRLSAVPGGEVMGAAHFELAPQADPESASDLGQQVMSFVRGRVGEIDIAAATRPGHVPSAAELAILGWDEVYRRVGPEVTAGARARFEQALRVDPGSIIVLDGLGAAHLQQRAMRVSLSASENAAGERAIEQAMQVAPNDATAALNWGGLQTLRGRPDLAIPAIEKSNRLTPGFANGHLMLARALLSVGRSAEVQPKIERAARLAALMGDAPRAAAAWTLGAEAAIMRNDDARAIEMARRGVAEHPRSREGHAVLAAAEWLNGQREEAAAEMAVFRRIAPKATVASYDEHRPSTNPVFVAERARFREALRQAGMPDR